MAGIRSSSVALTASTDLPDPEASTFCIAQIMGAWLKLARWEVQRERSFFTLYRELLTRAGNIGVIFIERSQKRCEWSNRIGIHRNTSQKWIPISYQTGAGLD